MTEGTETRLAAEVHLRNAGMRRKNQEWLKCFRGVPRFSLCLRVSAVNLPSPGLQQNAERLSHSEEKGLELHAASEIVIGTERGGELVGFSGG